MFNGSTPDDPPEQQTVAFQRAAVAAWDVRNATDLSLRVDGVRMNRAVRYEESRFSRSTWARRNIFGLPVGTTVDPAVDAGYAYLKALRPGPHTPHFGGRLPVSEPSPTPTLVDVTYHLTVET